MENKNTSSEIITDQSSYKTPIDENNNNNKQQQKFKSDDIIAISLKVPNRKLTMETQIIPKEFVPILKPIEIHLVPSKLRLDEIKFKYNKRNNNNKKELLSCFSCPCSEDESELNYKLNLSNSFDISDSSDLSDNDNTNENRLKDIRKKFSQLKSGSIHKVMTKKYLKNKKLSKHYLEINEKEEERIYEDSNKNSFSSEIYEDDNIFINYSKRPFDNNNKTLKLKQTKSSNIVNNSIKNYENININEEKNDNNNSIKKRDRIYSFSILDTLKNKINGNQL